MDGRVSLAPVLIQIVIRVVRGKVLLDAYH
jgi:hypothetical protein